MNTKEIKEQRKYAMELRKKVKRRIDAAPEGELRITHCHGYEQFRLIRDDAVAGGDYISKKNKTFISSLAAKEYDKRCLAKLDQIIRKAEYALDNPDELNVDAQLNCILDGQGTCRKKHIIPWTMTDDEYAEMWLNEEYEGKEFYEGIPEIYTEKGERVRSKSEKIIADKLYYLGIPYKYEHPLAISKRLVVYPDFTILDKKTRKEYILEHLGMMDNPEYAEKAVNKIHSYEAAGYFPGKQLILTFETKDTPINAKELEKLLAQYITA